MTQYGDFRKINSTEKARKNWRPESLCSYWRYSLYFFSSFLDFFSVNDLIGISIKRSFSSNDAVTTYCSIHRTIIWTMTHVRVVTMVSMVGVVGSSEKHR